MLLFVVLFSLFKKKNFFFLLLILLSSICFQFSDCLHDSSSTANTDDGSVRFGSLNSRHSTSAVASGGTGNSSSTRLTARHKIPSSSSSSRRRRSKTTKWKTIEKVILKSSVFDQILQEKDGYLNQLKAERQRILADYSSPSLQNNDATATALDQTQNVRLAIVDMKIHQLETLQIMLNASLESVRELISKNNQSTATDSTALDADLDVESLQSKFQELRSQNERIVSGVQEAAFQAQKDYQSSLLTQEQAESTQKKHPSLNSDDDRNAANNLMDGVWQDFDKSVDELEKSMLGEDKKFDQGKKVGKLETVVKLNDPEDEDEDEREDTQSNHEAAGTPTDANVESTATQSPDVSVHDDPSSSSSSPSSSSSSPYLNLTTNQESHENSLKASDYSPRKSKRPSRTLLDSENNLYVLAKPSDPTLHIEDFKLFHDLIVIYPVAFVLGLLADSIKLPSFFGYMLAGVLLGPSYLNQIKSLIQLQTLAQFGILLIMFVLGLEFSVEKIANHWRISGLGGSLVFIGITLGFVVLGLLLGYPVNQSFFVGSAVSLSSTTAVIKCLEEVALTTVGEAITGILILQDVILGFLLVLLPTLGHPNGLTSLLQALLAIARTIGFFGVSWIIGHVFVFIRSKIPALTKNFELSFLYTLAVCFVFIIIAERMGVSAEVAVFVAGLNINTKRSKLDASLVQRIESLRDFLACLFFTTIGLHVYPRFLFQQAPVLVISTLSIVGFKTFVGFFVYTISLKQDPRVSTVISIGLSQVSEFVFVLASRAKSNGIISKEGYYILLGATCLSLIITPFLWKVIRLTTPKHMLDQRENPKFNKPNLPFHSIIYKK